MFQIPTWINCTSNDSTQRIPCPVIKPVMKLVKAFFCQEASCTVIKVPENEMEVKHYFILGYLNTMHGHH